MKWLQNGNLAKLVAFFVIATVITCTVSFAANGWQSFTQDEPDSDNIVADNNTGNDDFDENQDGDKNNEGTNSDIPTIAPTPKYFHYLTGLEIDLQTSLSKPLCTVVNSTDPLYGLSSSFLTIEFPTEYGNTRLLCFTDDVGSIGKIGSLAPTRGYISNLASYFGGVLLSYGTDDTFDYDFTEPADKLDFKATVGYCYTEYNSYVYTNGDLVNAFINNSKTNTVFNASSKAPYVFNNSDSAILGNDDATGILISYGDGNSTELTYSSEINKYIFSKNNAKTNDLLNNKEISYDNVFILCADSTTYETAESTRLILNTSGEGTGKYISNGKMTDITWVKGSDGNLTFYGEDGQKLIVNPGNSYIGFTKSSSPSSIKIS